MTHESVLALLSDVDQSTKELQHTEAQLSRFLDLPPDVPAATAKLLEARATLERLRTEFNETVAAQEQQQQQQHDAPR